MAKIRIKVKPKPMNGNVSPKPTQPKEGKK